MAATGAWVAYDPDDNQPAALFSAELAAWRYGGPRKLDVVQWPFGMTLTDAIAESRADR